MLTPPIGIHAWMESLDCVATTNIYIGFTVTPLGIILVVSAVTVNIYTPINIHVWWDGPWDSICMCPRPQWIVITIYVFFRR